MAGNQNPFASIFGADPFGMGGFDGTGEGQGGQTRGPQGDFGGFGNMNLDDLNKVKDRFTSMSRKAIIASVIVAIVVLAVAYWWFHPPINIHSVDTWTFIIVFIGVPAFLIFRARSHAYQKGTAKKGQSDSKAKTFKTLSWLPVALIVVVLIGALMSASFFPGNAHKYASILSPEDDVFTEDIQEVNYDEIPVIDRDSAELLGNRTMGTMSDLVSQFEIADTYSQINYQDKPVRVSPLGYADLFKWLQNREEGIPAYVIVDMTTQEAQVVRLEGDAGIKYSESEPLARNIDRYVQLKYPFYMFGEKSFEIDDDGNPWWICPVRDFTIGLFGGETISRAVLVNAATGECYDYAVSDVPQWVDHVYPADLIIQQYNWHGAYSDGWFNSWLGQNGVVETTPGTDGSAGYNYIAKDDDVWLYTGVTSATGDKSIVGFVLVNQRTAEAHFYSVAGATEDSAMESAEGQVQNLRYEATFPILINVSDTPTYFMALKDDAGLVKKYAMVDIQSYQNVAVGDTVSETQKSYLALIAANGGNVSSTASDAASEANGVIKAVATAVIDGNSHFYVTLEGDDHIYDFALPGMIEIVQYSVGDSIAFTYIEGDPTSTAQAITSELKTLATSTTGVESEAADAAETSAENASNGDAASSNVSSESAAGESTSTNAA